MRFILHILFAIAIALGVGFGLSYYALSDGRLIAAREIGPWTVWPAAGNPHPDPYSRAYVARRGVLQLGLSEGLQFVAEADSDGQMLNARCGYQIVGQTPQAALWTLVALDRKGRNIGSSAQYDYLDSQHVVRAADGSFLLTVAPYLVGGNWLPITPTGPFRLVLTVYDTPALSGGPGDRAEMPDITRLECR